MQLQATAYQYNAIENKMSPKYLQQLCKSVLHGQKTLTTPEIVSKLIMRDTRRYPTRFCVMSVKYYNIYSKVCQPFFSIFTQNLTKSEKIAALIPYS